MIRKVVEQRGMSWTDSGGQGTVTQGSMNKQALYSYPLTPPSPLPSDAPTYDTLTESWAGMDTNVPPAVTAYSINKNDTCHDGNTNSAAYSVTVTQPNGTISKQCSYRTPNSWTDGLTFYDETKATVNGTLTTLASSLVSWQQGAYNTARPAVMIVTDERQQTKRTVLEYGTSYNQLITKKEYDYNNGASAGPLLRETQTDYENNAAYIYRHIFNLVKSNRVKDGAGNIISRTDYEYDNNAVVSGTQNHNLKSTPGVIMHNSTSDPYTTDTYYIEGGCLLWQYNYPECQGGEIRFVYVGDYPQFMVDCESERFCEEWQEPSYESVYDPNSVFRGNVTKITSYPDALNLANNPVINTRQYDVTGNPVAESASCCRAANLIYKRHALRLSDKLVTRFGKRS